MPFTGDAASYGDIVNATTVPVVAAGGPRCETLEEVLAIGELNDVLLNK